MSMASGSEKKGWLWMNRKICSQQEISPDIILLVAKRRKQGLTAADGITSSNSSRAHSLCFWFCKFLFFNNKNQQSMRVKALILVKERDFARITITFVCLHSMFTAPFSVKVNGSCDPGCRLQWRVFPWHFCDILHLFVDASGRTASCYHVWELSQSLRVSIKRIFFVVANF